MKFKIRCFNLQTGFYPVEAPDEAAVVRWHNATCDCGDMDGAEPFDIGRVYATDDQAPAWLTIAPDGTTTKAPVQVNAGRIVVTPSIPKAFHPGAIALALSRHLSGDWGDCVPGADAVNTEAAHRGGRILSVYLLGTPPRKLWIITEADRSTTTVLLPEEY